MSLYPVHLTPCPNDTFAIGALALGMVESHTQWIIELEDIETLNQRVCKGEKGIFKVSAALYPTLTQYRLLPCGGAFTYDAGPLLVANPAVTAKNTIALPGKHTTANYLLRFLWNAPYTSFYLPYHDICSAICSGVCDAGVVIHEARFTYADYGLVKVADLGQEWVQKTHAPLPLACMVAHDELQNEQVEEFIKAYRLSLNFAWSKPQSVLNYVLQQAQEQSEKVVWDHIHHFVSQYTYDNTPWCHLLELFRAPPTTFCDLS